jgi:GTP cyclohydrolase I
MEDAEGAIRQLLTAIGEDPAREGLRRTPARFIKAMLELTAGTRTPHVPGTLAVTFAVDTKQSTKCEPQTDDSCPTLSSSMVIVRDIKIFSLCEHHLLPFFGVIHVAYLPSAGRVLGLSKLARLAEVFARRLQIQERLTEQVAEALMQLSQAKGTGVMVECTHLCMAMRGACQPGTTTITFAFRGAFASDEGLQRAFTTQVSQRQNQHPSSML